MRYEAADLSDQSDLPDGRTATLTAMAPSSPYGLRVSNGTSKGVRGEENRVSDFSSPRRQTVAKYVHALSAKKREVHAFILQHVFLPEARVSPAHPAPGRAGRREGGVSASLPPMGSAQARVMRRQMPEGRTEPPASGMRISKPSNSVF